MIHLAENIAEIEPAKGMIEPEQQSHDFQ